MKVRLAGDSVHCNVRHVMKKLIHHSETEYDFCLSYWQNEPPKIGDTIPSGITDDDGKTIRFIGSAVVVAIESEQTSFPVRKTLAYIKQFPAIE
jgi:hypothetical protein